MRLPALRSVSVGFFGLLAGLLVVAWGASICNIYAVIRRPDAKSEIALTLIRSRLEAVYVARADTGRPRFNHLWAGAPRKTTDVLGAFSCDHYEVPRLGVPGATATVINIPMPFLAAMAATIAYLIYRRFRLTRAAWLSLFVVALAFSAVYAHAYQPEHYPSILEWGEWKPYPDPHKPLPTGPFFCT